MQLLGVEILNLREVKVFDQNGVVNVALNKAATQSSTYIGYDANWDAANAVDGDTAIALADGLEAAAAAVAAAHSATVAARWQQRGGCGGGCGGGGSATS